MKTKSNLLLGMLLGASIAGGLAFLFQPFLAKNESFLLGFIASTAFVACTLIPIVVLNRMPGLTLTVHSATSGLLRLFFFILLGVLIVLVFVWQNEHHGKQIALKQLQIAQQAELIETTRNSGLLEWMSQLLQQANDELVQQPGRKLSDETIAMIAALSYSFKPYLRLEGDSVIPKLLSPERGALLLALTRMNMDSGSMQKILLQAHFANAELKNADLRSALLSSADLHEVDLQGANLENASLQDADLWSANLWGANLRKANLHRAVLQRADMSWADLSEANVREADLNGAKLHSAQLRKTDMREATLQWTDARGAFFNEAILSGADLLGTSLQRTQLVSADLSHTNLKQANMIEANLTGANFTGADLTRTVVFEADWLTLLPGKRVIGAAEIQNLYHLVNESVGDKIEYCLEKK